MVQRVHPHFIPRLGRLGHGRRVARLACGKPRDRQAAAAGVGQALDQPPRHGQRVWRGRRRRYGRRWRKRGGRTLLPRPAPLCAACEHLTRTKIILVRDDDELRCGLQGKPTRNLGRAGVVSHVARWSRLQLARWADRPQQRRQQRQEQQPPREAAVPHAAMVHGVSGGEASFCCCWTYLRARGSGGRAKLACRRAEMQHFMLSARGAQRTAILCSRDRSQLVPTPAAAAPVPHSKRPWRHAAQSSR